MDTYIERKKTNIEMTDADLDEVAAIAAALTYFAELKSTDLQSNRSTGSNNFIDVWSMRNESDLAEGGKF